MLIFRARFLSTKIDPHSTLEHSFRVSLTDIDFYKHITNAKYASFLDLLRVEFWLRSGMWEDIKSRGMIFLLASSFKRYRKELKLNATFKITSKIIYIGPDFYYIESKFIKDNFIHCHAVDKLVIVKPGVGRVSPQEMFTWADKSLLTPPSYIKDLEKTDQSFRNVTLGESFI
jgi:acyl-CoA thioesterase FadM